jgi:ATP-binding cassette subfamily B protein
VTEHRERPKVQLKRLVALARPELGRLIVATIALLLSSAATLIFPQAIRFMVDGLAGGDAPFSLNTGAVLLALLFLAQSVFAMLRAWLFTAAGERIVANLRVGLFEAIVGQDIEFFDHRRTGELTNRLSVDTTIVQNTVTVNLATGLRLALGAVGGVAFLLWMSPRITLVAMAVVPPGAVAATYFGRVMRGLSRKVQDALAASNVVAEETIAGIRTVRSFARESHEVGRYEEAVDRSYRLAARRAVAIGGFRGFIGFVGYGAVALVVWYGGGQVISGGLTIGELTAFLLYTGIVAVSVGGLASLYAEFTRAAGASERIFELLDQKGSLEMGGGEPVSEVTGRLRFEGVDFSYPARSDVAVLRGFELVVEPGEVVALVGPSGAGKSTVASLIPRFYDPTRGRITLDGKELQRFDPRSLRQKIGAVMQEPVLFAESVADNIRYGRPEASDEEVRQAARDANAASFIEEFPEGYDTLVGERGVRLSGGQKQRVAIARAVLKDPRILILDEATSALDAESEHLVHEALDRLMEGRTTIVIAHRLSTVRNADRVAVMDRGAVEESGTHSDLMRTDGLYRRLVVRQFSDWPPLAEMGRGDALEDESESAPKMATARDADDS